MLLLLSWSESSTVEAFDQFGNLSKNLFQVLVELVVQQL